jgi:Flp pilus assembly protein TadD
MVVWPAGLSAEYDPVIHQVANSTVVGALLFLLVISAATVFLLSRNRRFGFWVLFFFVGLIPVSQIVPLVTLINDRYLYFPMLGVAALSGGASAWLWRRFETARGGGAVKSLLTGALVLLAFASWQRAGVWRDDLSLWSDAVAKYPEKSSVQSAMGDVFLGIGREDEAWQAYENALRLNPRELDALLNLGSLYSRKGDLETGQRMLTEVVMLDPRNFKGWANLGNNLVLHGDYPEAEKAYKRALELQPDELKVLALLGNVALLQREPDKARDYLLRAEAKGGNDPDIACGLARAAALAGRTNEALGWLDTALKRGYIELEQLHEYRELDAVLRSPAFIDAVRRYVPVKSRER